MIPGIPNHYIETVKLENVEISYPVEGTAKDSEIEVLEDIARYP